MTLDVVNEEYNDLFNIGSGATQPLNLPKTPNAAIPILLPKAANPELDYTIPADHWWMHDASPDIINAKRVEGYRLFRLKSTNINPLRFSALFVRNTGAYQRDHANWEYGLTAGDVMARTNNPDIRITDVCPYPVDKGVKFAIVTVSNKPPFKKNYKVVLNHTLSFEGLLEQAKSLKMRIIDIDKISQPGVVAHY